MHGEDQPAFYFLSPSLEINKAFFFENPEIPYDPPLPERGGVSPMASDQTFSAQELDKGEFLCEPFMSYRGGQIIRNFPFRLQPAGDQVSMEPLTPFPVKRLADGTRLIRYGPDRSLGLLWRKAYETYSMRIFALTPSLLAYEALSLAARSDSAPGYEIERSDDWRTVTEFLQDGSGKWTAEKFCLSGHTYRSCGKDPESPPPRKRVLTSDQ